jgi:hypothetical protein
VAPPAGGAGPAPGGSRGLFAATLLGCFLLSALAFWPVVCNRLAAAAGPVFAADALAPRWVFRHSALMPVFWACAGLAAVHGALAWRGGRRPTLAALALGLALLHNVAAVLAAEQLSAGRQLALGVARGDTLERRWPQLERLRIVECPPPDTAALYAGGRLRAADLDSFAALHRYARARFAEQRRQLRARWGVADERKLRALFYLNFVSGLWAFGNRDHPDRPGGVLSNEENGWTPPPRPTVRTYLASHIACCTDFACVLKSLLDHEGIENRLTCIPGHRFNEARLGGRWHILDATTNLCAEAGWEELYGRRGGGPDSVRVLLFPHPGLAATSSSRYRAAVGQFRLLMLMRLATRPEALRAVEHPALPPYFD